MTREHKGPTLPAEVALPVGQASRLSTGPAGRRSHRGTASFFLPFYVVATLVVVGCLALHAQDRADVQELLNRPIIGPDLGMSEVQAFTEARVPKLPDFKTSAEWEKYAESVRAAMFERVVFRGQAAAWRDAKTNVEWLDTIAGGVGYRIKKLRYEALPGLWIPALLYEPENLAGKVPVALNVNGHDVNGKAAPYKQIRSINQAKRGMIVLNVEWLGMGQLRTTGFAHGRMNQLDLCGTSGLAPFYLSMKRGLDVLLGLKNADPERVVVSGLSGGGWQTIFISALDTRVKLANPVAGYSSFATRARHLKDLGDSEQTPCDMATVADYTHMTALLAPRPTLLTYCAKDNCCFEAGYALPPLLDAARPVFRLLGREEHLRAHVNHDPGTHNFEKDNRQAHYRMLVDHFLAGDKKQSGDEIPSDDEVKKNEELAVELPSPNEDFNTLARKLCKDLPRSSALPTDVAGAQAWQQAQRQKLRDVIRTKDFAVVAEKAGTGERNDTKATYWRLKMGESWTVPVVELVRGKPKGTSILVSDTGRSGDPAHAERLLAAGQRVLAAAPFYFGESKIAQKDYLFALLVAAVGDRPLGIQANQVAALARWSLQEYKTGSVTLVAVGPRTCTIALVAAGLEERAIGKVELHGLRGSLKEIIEENRSVEQMPEQFCFGLLEHFDCKQLVALAAPRLVRVVQPSARAKSELAGLKEWYRALGTDFDPLQ